MTPDDRRDFLARAGKTLGLVAAFAAFGADGVLAADHPALALVKGFYKPRFDQQKMPLSARLNTLYRAALARSKKDDGVVSGLDFSWMSNSQDADDTWFKSARFETLNAGAAGAEIKVFYKTFADAPEQSQVYRLVLEGKRWKVDEISFAGEDPFTLSETLAKGARGE